METLLSFLTVKLKQNKMTVDQLCKKIGISRQKFYRFVKEPYRFPEESVAALISVLSLDGQETGQLKSYLRQQPQTEPVPDLLDYSDLIEGIFRHRLSAELAPDLEAIGYTQAGSHVTMESPASFARILAGLRDGTDRSGPAASPASGAASAGPQASDAAAEVPAADVSAALTHEYDLTLYNCVPSIADRTKKRLIATARCIQTIASIVKELEDVLIPVSTVRIRIRHYMTNRRREQMRKDDPHDQAAMSFQLQLLDTLLPLLSMAEDYSIETADDPNTVWTSRGDTCLIRHTCRSSSSAASAQDVFSVSDQAIRTDYYSLGFSENGDCRACRLGSDEVSHIYRFLTPDGRAASSFIEKNAISNPSLELYERYKDYQIIMIYPDLYFDDIPPKLWMSLYEEIEKKDDKKLYQKAFRKLIDPFNQYTFLSFENLVQAVLQTMEQRAETAGRMGHSVICHPAGLFNMVQTGMISDLTVGSEGCSASSWSATPLRFPAPVIRELLEMIRSSILWRQSSGVSDPSKYGRVNYYILHPQFPLPEISFHIYGGRGVIPLYMKGRHKHVLANVFDCPAAATILFDFVGKEMIGKRGENLRSDILSDEHSIALIDRLIAMVDEM